MLFDYLIQDLAERSVFDGTGCSRNQCSPAKQIQLTPSVATALYGSADSLR